MPPWPGRAFAAARKVNGSASNARRPPSDAESHGLHGRSSARQLGRGLLVHVSAPGRRGRTGARKPRPSRGDDATRGRRRAPGLLAFEGDEPVGWIAIAPRKELRRVDASRATPRVDDVDVWVIPCITVRPSARGRGIALTLIRAAVAYAKGQGAPAVEAYPRAGSARTKDDNAYFGTEPLFRRAGFRVVRKAASNAPPNRVRRVTMRIEPRRA